MGNRLFVRARKRANEKRMRALSKRIQELRPRWNVEDRERVALEKPVFWGYRRRLVLKKVATKRKDAGRLLELLVFVQKEEDSKRKDFKHWNRIKRRWEVSNHTPRHFWSYEFSKIPSHLRRYFEFQQMDLRRGRYRVQDPSVFDSRLSKLYLTHRFLPNVERERELSYTTAKFEQLGGWNAFQKVKSRKARWKTWGHTDPKRRHFDAAYCQELQLALCMHSAGELNIERGKEVIEIAET
jgi:hypothetical protein